MPPMIHELLTEMKQKGGSDLHIAPDYPILMRIHGDLTAQHPEPLTAERAEVWFRDLLSDRLSRELDQNGEVDFSIEVPGVTRARANLFQTENGLRGAFRSIPEDIPSADDLNLPDSIRAITNLRSGLVLVTGPTGSGKSTTLAAIINEINEEREAHIITIEDPIEFVHPPKKALVTQRAVGEHAPSFTRAIRDAGREDPDIILVGEMRDLDTIEQALTCAEFGILVLGTLHTNSAAKTVDRIIDSFPSDRQSQVRSMLAESLRTVVAQRLLKTKDGKGRCAVFEVLVVNSACSNLIREGKTSHLASVMQTGTQSGMQTMDQALADRVMTGDIALEAALELAKDPDTLRRVANGQA